MARVSIILPNRNHATELRTALEAIAGQTRAPDEVILIEDASTDESLAVIDSYRARLGPLKLLRNDKRQGVARAVQRGIEAATGDYILLASADEKLAPDACRTLAEVADSFPDAKLIVSQFAEWWPAERRVRVHGRESDLGMWYVEGEAARFITPEQFRRFLRRRFVWLAANTALIRRDVLLEVGGFDPRLEWHSDWFALYAIAFRHGFCAVPRSLAWFRVASDSYSMRGMRDARAQRKVALEIQRKLRTPAFRDIDAAVMAAPAAMSTFMRATLLALAARPRWYGRLGRLACWWLGQFLLGRRPAAWSRLLRRIGGRSERSEDHARLDGQA